jgi:hypothetical protein
VNAAGLAGLTGTQVSLGFELARLRVTLRMDGTQMTVMGHDGTAGWVLGDADWPASVAHKVRLRF